MKLQTQKTQIVPQTPLVTVLMPVYNGAEYLLEAIESVQKSTFRDFEFVLINDGSKDESEKICRAMAKKYDNIRFFNFRKNRGLVAALNFGLSKARGTYICRLNQDDTMLPHRIATQVAFLDTHEDVAVVGSWIHLIHVDQNNDIETLKFLETDEQIKHVWHILSPFSDPSVMYRKNTALTLGGYDKDYFIAEDVHMWIRMGAVAKLANIQSVLTEVRFHEASTTYTQFRHQMKTTYRLHRWMHNHVAKAPLHIQAFWLVQLAAGMIFPPQYVYGTYRQIKTVINFFISLQKKATINHLLSVAKI